MTKPKKRGTASVVYDSITKKIYSGGLGILAGDYLKETSDMNVNLVAVCTKY